MPLTPKELLALLDSFDWDEWSKRLRDGIEPIYRDTVRIAAEQHVDEFDFDDPFTSKFMTSYIGERIVQLDDFTKANVSDFLRTLLDAEGGGRSTFELAQLVAEETRKHVKGYETWRAHRIARTESGYAYNHGTVLGGKQAGVETFHVTDGDKDEPCASANGSIWTVDQCLSNALGHPNCTRAFTPNTESSR